MERAMHTSQETVNRLNHDAANANLLRGRHQSSRRPVLEGWAERSLSALCDDQRILLPAKH